MLKDLFKKSNIEIRETRSENLDSAPVVAVVKLKAIKFGVGDAIVGRIIYVCSLSW